ncbi:MAG: hypothetical protein CMI27_02350 [Opitutae bacterium]|nr:hypothetical protein [Opitutae bacterium]
MKLSIRVLVFSFILSVVLASCSKKIEPETSLNRIGSSTGSEFTDPSRGFNSGGDDFSPVGNALSGDLSGSNLLSQRDPGLEAFNDPLNVIRPFEPVYFGFDQYNLGASERPKLGEIAQFLGDNGNARLLVEGYCDWKGTPAYNKSLGERRANTVKEYLIELGADPLRIETVSIGDETAIPNADGENARLDRRAAFVVSKGI